MRWKTSRRKFVEITGQFQTGRTIVTPIILCDQLCIDNIISNLPYLIIFIRCIFFLSFSHTHTLSLSLPLWYSFSWQFYSSLISSLPLQVACSYHPLHEQKTSIDFNGDQTWCISVLECFARWRVSKRCPTWCGGFGSMFEGREG